MQEKTLLLNTTLHDFANWLKHHTERDRPQRVPTDNGSSWSLSRAGAWPLLVKGKTVITMDKGPQLFAPDPAISLEVIPLAAERVEVIARCWAPEVADYFENLVRTIQERFSPQIISTAAGKMESSENNENEFLAAETRKRRDEIKRLRQDKGLTIYQISQRIPWSESTIKRDLKALGLTKKRPN